MRVALLEMLHPDLVEGDAPIPRRGRDRRGGRDREAVLRRRRRPGSSTASWARRCATCARMARAMPDPRLDDLVERLERAAAELRGGELDAGARRGARGRVRAAGRRGERRARPARARRGCARPGRARPASSRWDPEPPCPRPRPPSTPTICAPRSTPTSTRCGSRASPTRRGWRRRCATRCWPAGSGSGRCWRSRRRGRSGATRAWALPFAAALELIHTYSLIHDDLPAMDDDDLRRGRPTCHVRYGEDVAILAGDGLYAEAFRLALHEQAGEPADVLAAVAELADATGVNGMVGGQYIDVRAIADGSEGSLRRLHELKTGRLIGASVECVLLLNGASDPSPTLSDFRAFAAELGVLFQIVDDVLDVTGTDADLGKPQGSDERHGKLTYVTRYGLDGARDAGRGVAPQRAGGPGQGDRRRPRARADHRLHRLPQLMTLLDRIDRPQDLHGLTEDELEQVAQEVRELLIDTVGEIGGHFGANLGTCEIAVALHSLLDSPTDKILWDVGHQAYPHKILTGRRDALRHDPQVRRPRPVLRDPRVRARHHGRRPRLDLDRLRRRDQGGDAPRRRRRRQGRRGDRRRRDDRRRRLRGDPPGRRPRHAARRRSSTTTACRSRRTSARCRATSTASGSSRACGRRARASRRSSRGCRPASARGSSASARSSRSRSRRSGLPGLFWEELDWAYMGVIDGHDVRALRRALRAAFEAERPVVVHCATVKGKGFSPAEDGGLEGMEKWHAAKPNSIAKRMPAPSQAGRRRADAAAVHAGVRRGARAPSASATTASSASPRR